MVDGHGIKQEADYDDPDKLYGMLIARIQKYHPSADVTQIEKAYNLAKKAHGDQKRKSGEPYIIHPLWVAILPSSDSYVVLFSDILTPPSLSSLSNVYLFLFSRIYNN